MNKDTGAKKHGFMWALGQLKKGRAVRNTRKDFVLSYDYLQGRDEAIYIDYGYGKWQQWVPTVDDFEGPWELA